MKLSTRPPLFLLLAFLLLLLGAVSCQPAQTSQSAPRQTNDGPPPGDRARVEWVYDGDTIEVSLDGRTYDVRYIGVDTPERDEYFYDEAFDFNMDLVRGETVILVRDVSDTDQYGRLLRYIYKPDGTFVNAELISNGMARLVTFPPDTANTEYFKALESEARRRRPSGCGPTWSRPGHATAIAISTTARTSIASARRKPALTICMDKTGEDVHHLDGGGDGCVCESLR